MAISKMSAGCNRGDDCDCGSTPTPCLLFDNSADNNLDNFNITTADSPAIVNAGTYGSAVAMSGGNLLVEGGAYAAYPKMGRTWCGFNAACYRTPSPPDEVYVLPIEAIDWNDASLRAMSFRFTVFDLSADIVFRFAEIFKLNTDSPVWPQQQIVRSGSATSGHWNVRLGDCGKVLTGHVGANGSAVDSYSSTIATALQIAYDAPANEVLFGIMSNGSFVNSYPYMTIPWYATSAALPFTVTSSSIGRDPNATFTVTFNGMVETPTSGPLPALTIDNQTDTGSFAVTILAGGPEIAPLAYYELVIASNSGGTPLSAAKLRYHGPNFKNGSPDSTDIIDIEFDYPFGDPCQKALPALPFEVEITHATNIPELVAAGIGGASTSPNNITIRFNGETYPAFRTPTVYIPPDYDPDVPSLKVASAPFLYDFVGAVLGPSFRGGTVRGIKAFCPTGGGSQFNGVLGSTPETIYEGGNYLTPNCPGHRQPWCSETETTPELIKISGIDFSTLVGALPSDAKFNFSTHVLEPPGGDNTTLAAMFANGLAQIAALDQYLIRARNCTNVPGGNLAYVPSCFRSYLLAKILSPFEDGANDWEKTPVALSVASDVHGTLQLDPSEYPYGAVVLPYNVAVSAYRVYDKWVVKVQANGTGVAYWHHEIDPSLGDDGFTELVPLRSIAISFSATWVSCPCDISQTSITLYPIARQPFGGEIANTPFMNARLRDAGFWTWTGLTITEDTYAFFANDVLSGGVYGSGPHQLSDSNSSAGTGSISGHDVIGSIVLSYVDSLPGPCTLPRGKYHGCDTGIDYVVVEAAIPSPMIKVKTGNECATRTGPALDSDTTNDTIAEALEGDCGTCQGCGLCNGKIYAFDLNLFTNWSFIKYDPLAGDGDLGGGLFTGASGLGFVGFRQSDGSAGINSLSWCDSVDPLDFSAFSNVVPGVSAFDVGTYWYEWHADPSTHKLYGRVHMYSSLGYAVGTIGFFGTPHEDCESSFDIYLLDVQSFIGGYILVNDVNVLNDTDPIGSGSFELL